MENKAAPLLQGYIDKGRMGVKSGRGFYSDYADPATGEILEGAASGELLVGGLGRGRRTAGRGSKTRGTRSSI
ncbi:hypothetical protein [Arthrobacter sp. NicSoilC5]|uniref:hypothetical protein n=1 Tax=Arthrobacter sp. NicSoilC5 TaxID=2831000 RepID=UPI001CC3A1B0|nr:hypothetical protein [Arthrobacter sp. NicSoilC5]BCW78419.1 hypothetical protein NicSoilC5_04380 [Arthrobacter sp. NicSoilC5]